MGQNVDKPGTIVLDVMINGSNLRTEEAIERKAESNRISVHIPMSFAMILWGTLVPRDELSLDFMGPIW